MTTTMIPSDTIRYQEIRDDLLALAKRRKESSSLRRAVQLTRAAIFEAKDAHCEWEEIAEPFRRRGFPNAKAETIRSYYGQPDAKIISKQDKMQASSTDSTQSVSPVASPDMLPYEDDLKVESLDNTGLTIPGYLK